MGKISKKEIKRRIEYFKDRVQYFIGYFGLSSWEIVIFEERNKPDARASCYFGSSSDGGFNCGKIASIYYSTWWIHSTELTDQEINKTAFHEIWEVILSDLRLYSENNEHVVPSFLVDQSVHDVIRLLENKLLPLIKDM